MKYPFWRALGLTFFASLCLALGFLPAIHSIAAFIGPSRLLPNLLFPVAAAGFWFNLRWVRDPPQGLPNLKPWLTLPLPLLIAIAYGALTPEGNLLRDLTFSQEKLISLSWIVLFAPLGEELLFRGWFYNLIEALWPNRLVPATNPLPLSIWMSSLAFSIWHLQELSHSPAAWVLFQASYAFLLGVWFGVLRWKTRSLWLPFAAHSSVNLCANLL